MRSLRNCGLVLLAAMVPAVAQAHPGHGDTDAATLHHYLLEAPHVGPLLIAGVAVAGCILIVHRILRSNSNL